MESPLEIPEEEFHAADAWITVCANWAVGRSECFLARRGMEDDCLLPGLLHDVLRESISDILQGRVIPPLTGQWLRAGHVLVSRDRKKPVDQRA